MNHDWAFWTGFYPDDDDCFRWASDKAYLDMNRTMEFSEKTSGLSQEEQKDIAVRRAGWRASGTAIIQTAIQHPTHSDFAEWHRGVCDQLLLFYNEGGKLAEPFTYGQAQKWLNMMLKYLWLLYRQHRLPDASACAFIEKHQSALHIPLDSYILRYVAKRKKRGKPLPDNGLDSSVSFDTEWYTLDQTWSNIHDYDAYAAYQQKLIAAIQTKGSSPLEWELIHWHYALNYYDKKDNG